MIGYIYKTTNLKNGKIYIGQHQATIFEPNNYIGSGKELVKAVAEFGRDNFKNELVCWCETIDELNAKEIYWIAKYNATDTAVGYNIAEGGSGVSMTDAIKQQIANTLISQHLHCYNNGKVNKYFGDNDPIPEGFVLGRILVNVSEEEWKLHASIASSNAIRPPHTEEAKKKIRESHIGEKVYNNGIIEIRCKSDDEIPEGFVRGSIMTAARLASLEKSSVARDLANANRKYLPEDIRKEKYGKHNLGRTPPNARKIICIETGEVFNSIRAISSRYNVSQYRVQSAIQKNCELCGYHWNYAV